MQADGITSAEKIADGFSLIYVQALLRCRLLAQD
jgi:hypothetical protein